MSTFLNIHVYAAYITILQIRFYFILFLTSSFLSVIHPVYWRPVLCPRKSWAVLRRSAMPPKKSLRRTRPSVATASVFLCRRSMSTTFSITHSVVLRRCLKFAFWSNGGSECYAWLRWRPFISRNCRHCTTLASSSNIPYCIVLLTDIWTMFSVLIIIIAIIVFVLHYFWYYNVYYCYFEPYHTPSLNTRHT